jgi:ribosomal protein S18 acetylase RimI-like enzyme
MFTSISIRRLTRQDAAQFRDVRLHGLLHDPVAFNGCYEEESRLSKFQFANFIKEPPSPSAIFGAFFDNCEIVGIAGLAVSNALKMQHKGTLWGMYTMPIARGLGVGTALMTAVLDYARDLSLERVLLSVTASNTSTSQWYAKLGFQLYGIERNAVKFGSLYEDDELRSLALFTESIADETQMGEIGQQGLSTSLSDRLPGREL